jgi:hypothetical protein
MTLFLVIPSPPFLKIKLKNLNGTREALHSSENVSVRLPVIALFVQIVYCDSILNAILILIQSRTLKIVCCLKGLFKKFKNSTEM